MITTYIGLGLIAVAWLTQFIMMSKSRRDHEISYPFMGLYVLGTLFLVWDQFTRELTTEAALNIVTLFGALLVLLRLKR